MNVAVRQVLDIVLKTRSTYVAFLIEVTAIMDAVYDLREGEHANVELSHGRIVPETTAYQQRIVNVLLYDPRLVASRLL